MTTYRRHGLPLASSHFGMLYPSPFRTAEFEKTGCYKSGPRQAAVRFAKCCI
jgi:hypothetical protein